VNHITIFYHYCNLLFWISLRQTYKRSGLPLRVYCCTGFPLLTPGIILCCTARNHILHTWTTCIIKICVTLCFHTLLSQTVYPLFVHFEYYLQNGDYNNDALLAVYITFASCRGSNDRLPDTKGQGYYNYSTFPGKSLLYRLIGMLA